MTRDQTANEIFDSSVMDPLLVKHSQSWIGNETVASAGETMPHLNPADGSSLGDTQSADAATVDRAVRSARQCFEGEWARFSPADRKRVLSRFAELLSTHSRTLSALETLEVGRPFSDALVQNANASALVHSYINRIDRPFGDVFRAEESRLGVVWRRPRGVVAAITPWNVPVMNVLIRICPALAAGNTIVVKPSENSPRSALLLASLAAEAGLPAGAFNVVLGPGKPVGEVLAAHPDINLVTFTGSTRTGQAVALAAAKSSLKPVLLECGGKSPQIILDDAFADERIWPLLFFASFWNTSQWCVAKTRLLVPRSRVRDAVDGLSIAAKQWLIADPRTDQSRMGPLANQRQLEQVQSYFEMADRLGSVANLGCPRGPLHDRGCYSFPSVVTDLPRGTALSLKEIFGPLVTIEAFDSLDEAIELANETEYGLSASIWTNRSDEGFRLARSVRAGGISVYASVDSARQAGPELGTGRYFEPQKQSGFGIEGGDSGYLAYTLPQSVAFFH